MATTITSPQPYTAYPTTGAPEQPVTTQDPAAPADPATTVDPAELQRTIEELRQWQQILAAGAGDGQVSGDFAATPISLPEVESPGEMSSLSTADLLQLLRAESRKTTELLMQSTMESIKNQQAQIELNSKSTIASLQEQAKALEKAENMQQAMKIVKWVATAVAVTVGVLAIVATGGAATPLVMAGISLALMATTMVLGQIKDEDGKSIMDKFMEKAAAGMQSLSEDMQDQPAWLQWAEAGAAAVAAVALAVFVDPKTLSFMLPLVAALTVSALPDSVMSDEAKGQAMAAIVMIGVTMTLSVYAAGAASSAGSSATKLVNISADTATAARKLAMLGSIAQAGTDIGSSSLDIAASAQQYNADMAQADVEELKELVKMLQTLLDGDTSFIQMLADIQAQLDSGCAQIVSLEHQTNENINREIYS